MVAVAEQASGSSRLSLIPALTCSHCQPKAADSERELRSESECRMSHSHDHRDCQALAPAPCHSDPNYLGLSASGPTEVQVLILIWGS